MKKKKKLEPTLKAFYTEPASFLFFAFKFTTEQVELPVAVDWPRLLLHRFKISIVV